MAKPTTPTDPLAAIAAALTARQEARAELAAVQAATPPLEETIALALSRMDQQVAEGQAQLTNWVGALATPPGVLHDVTLMGRRPETGEAVLVALHRDQLVTQIQQTLADFHEQHVAAGGRVIPGTEQQAAVEAAEAAAFAAEVALEAAYEAAEQAGHLVQRPSDLAPEAFLGIARGASVPHDFSSAKLEALSSRAEGARAAVDASSAAWQAARVKLYRLQAEVDACRFNLQGKRMVPDDLKTDFAAAERDASFFEAQRQARMDEASRAITLPARCRDYLEKHRLPRPCRGVHNPQLRRPGDPDPAEPLPWRERFGEQPEEQVGTALPTGE